MWGLLAVLVWLVLPVLLALLGLPERWVQLAQAVLLVPLVLWALLVLRERRA